MIKDKLILASGHAAVKVAGLYLLSDILHNSGAPVKHASNYRGLVQSVLPEVFADLAALFRNNSLGRMSAFQVRNHISRLFAAAYVDCFHHHRRSKNG